MVEINSINSVGTREMFQGAYSMRVMQNRMQEAQQAAAAVPKKNLSDVAGNVSVEISRESQAFLDAAPERKAAARAAAAAAQGTEAVRPDPFAGTGDLKKQYLVFSEQLYNAGFYDKMSDEGVKQTENLLRDITSSMDMISPNSLFAVSHYAPSQAGAQLDLAASVEGLNAFADKYLEGETKENFQALVAAYEEHNTPIVDSHQNLLDRRDMAMALLPPASTLSSVQGTYGEPETAEAAASRKLGAVQHTLAQNQQFRKDVASVFQSIRRGDLKVASALANLQSTFMHHASGDSLDARVRSVVAARNENVFAHINAYWDTLMNLSPFS